MTMLLFALLSSACVYQDKDGEKPWSDFVDYRLQRWEAKTTEPERVLAAGCTGADHRDADPRKVATFSAPSGQTVVWTVLDRNVVASSVDPPQDVCALDGETQHYSTINLDCWEFQEGSVRVLESEMLPSDRRPLFNEEPDRVPGSGRRLVLEVLTPGIFAWQIKESCGSNWYPEGYVRRELEILPPDAPTHNGQ